MSLRLVVAGALTVLSACGGPQETVRPSPPSARWSDVLATPATVRMAEMTAGEIAAAQKSGRQLVIVPIGGVEQNGPHVVTAKHDIIVTAMATKIAMGRGDALVSSTVSFVPEGSIDPPSGHMLFPGTIGLRDATYQALLTDISESLLATGFSAVVLIGDSGGNQAGMQAVARAVPGVFALDAYYVDDGGEAALLEAAGIKEEKLGIHSSVAVEAMLAAIDHRAIRYDARAQRGELSTNAVDISNLQALQALGDALISARADRTNAAIDVALLTDGSY